MDFNAFEEPSPFASFWAGGNHDLDADMPSSLGSLAAQPLQHADIHDQPHQSEDKIDATPTPSPQNALNTTTAVADVAGGQDQPPAPAEAQPLTETEVVGVADQETREATPVGVTQIEGSPARETSAMETTQTPSVTDAQESRAQTEHGEGEPSSVRSERATSVPSPSPPVAIESALSESPEPLSLAEEVAESAGDAEEKSAPDAQIYEEVLAHTPAKESPRQLEATPRQPSEPPEPQAESTPLERRRQSASEVIPASAEKDVGREEESQGRHASAPAMAIREPSEPAAEKPQVSTPLPEPLETKTPAKLDQTTETDAIQTSAIKNQEARSKSSSREVPQAETDLGAKPEDSSKPTVITPATARRGRLAMPVEKSTEKETPKRRGRPPKDAATPSSAKLTTPASQSKRMSVRGQAPSTDKGPARRVAASAQRKVSIPRTLARVVKRASAATPKVSTSASGAKRRGRPPKDAGSSGAVVTPVASKVEAKAVPGRRTRTSLGAAQAEPAASRTKAKARTARQPAQTTTRTGAIKTDKTPPKRRGRPPKATSAGQSKEQPKIATEQRRGRQPKSATSEKSKPSAATVPTSPPKRRGRPPRSAAAEESKPEPVVSGGARSTTGPRRRQSEKQEAAPEPITRKRGRVEEPKKENEPSTQKRGRPRRAAETVEEEPQSKRRRLRGPVKEANEGVKEKEKEKEKQAEAGKSRRGRPAKAITTTTLKAEKVAAPAASERAQLGRRAVVVAPPPSHAGRPGRKPKDVADAKRETKTKTSPVAKTRGRPGRPAAVQGAMAKAARPRGVVKTSLPLRSSRRVAAK